MFTTGELVSGNFRTSGDQIKVTMNPGGGSGGTCFGDSGGPDLLAGTSTVIAVNSYVTNYNCAGVGYDTRIDLPDRLAWIRGFLSQIACPVIRRERSSHREGSASRPVPFPCPPSISARLLQGT